MVPIQINYMAMKECENAITSVHVCVLMLDARNILRSDRPFHRQELILAGKVRHVVDVQSCLTILKECVCLALKPTSITVTSVLRNNVLGHYLFLLIYTSLGFLCRLRDWLCSSVVIAL